MINKEYSVIIRTLGTARIKNYSKLILYISKLNKKSYLNENYSSYSC